MNMAGHQGKGVSAWLSMATSYAWQRWADICDAIMQQSHANRWNHHADVLNKNISQFFWHDKWFARGITDAGRPFGIKQDQQGSIYLNPQSWAMLAGVVDTYEADGLIAEVEQHLGTPYGLEMLGPPYTEMVEDIGRLTQKFPGTAENGSVYNHAAAFYAFALYQQGKSEQGYAALARMLVTPEDALQREQLPVFIPNYYRGAMKQHPSHAGRSSQLFNTGTVAWFYRCIVEGLFGVSGTFDGLEFNPQLPNAWSNAKVVRRFRGARFNIQYKRRVTFQQLSVYVDGQLLDDNVFKHTIAGKEYQVDIHIPQETT
jgi:cellobionic acid phosphorylase